MLLRRSRITRRAGRIFHVHNLVPHVEEVLTHEGLREEVSDVVGCRHERNSNFALFDTFPNKEVTPLDMLNPRVMFRVVGQVDRRLVVKLQRWSICNGDIPRTIRIQDFGGFEKYLKLHYTTRLTALTDRDTK